MKEQRNALNFEKVGIYFIFHLSVFHVSLIFFPDNFHGRTWGPKGVLVATFGYNYPCPFLLITAY